MENDSQKLVQIQQENAAFTQIRSSANWLFFIAGLSIINSVLVHTGADLTFVVGLGLTQIIDGIMLALLQEASSGQYLIYAVGGGLIALTAGIFALLGYFAQRGSMIAFIVAIIIYGFDTLIPLGLGIWMSVAFHGLALFMLVRGVLACRTLKQFQQIVLTTPEEGLPQTTVI